MNRILLMDHDKNDASQLSKMLGGLGYLVSVAYNANTAFALYRRERFKLLIAEILAPTGKPEIGGINLISRIRLKERTDSYKLPIITISNAPATKYSPPVVAPFGANFHLEKPISQDSLKDAINKAVFSAPRL